MRKYIFLTIILSFLSMAAVRDVLAQQNSPVYGVTCVNGVPQFVALASDTPASAVTPTRAVTATVTVTATRTPTNAPVTPTRLPTNTPQGTAPYFPTPTQIGSVPPTVNATPLGGWNCPCIFRPKDTDYFSIVPRFNMIIRIGPDRGYSSTGQLATKGKTLQVYREWMLPNGETWGCLEQSSDCRKWFIILADLDPVDGVLETYADDVTPNTP
jgi:hypothetical protein